MGLSCRSGPQQPTVSDSFYVALWKIETRLNPHFVNAIKMSHSDPGVWDQDARRSLVAASIEKFSIVLCSFEVGCFFRKSQLVFTPGKFLWH